MSILMYWTGVVVWTFVIVLLLAFTLLYLSYFWNKTLRPCCRNLSFAFFGKGRQYKGISYYQLWDGIINKPYVRRTMKRRHHHYSRLVWRKLILEARRESLQRRRPSG